MIQPLASFRDPSLILAAIAILGTGFPDVSPAEVGMEEGGLPSLSRHDLNLGGASTRDGSLGAWSNPAAWALGESDLAFWWRDEAADPGALDAWGLSGGGPLGFGVQSFRSPDAAGNLRTIQETHVGMAHGNRQSHWGFAYRWAAQDNEAVGRESGLVLGTIQRPNRKLSWGASSFISTESSSREGLLDVGIRPFGSPHTLLFADYSLQTGERVVDGEWSGGVAFRLISGLQLGLRATDSNDTEPSVTALVGITLSNVAFEALTHTNDENRHVATTGILRLNPPLRPLDPTALGMHPRSHAFFDLEAKQIDLQKDDWFDDDRVSWIDLSQKLQEIERNVETEGVFVNLAGARIPPAILWEMRESFKRLSRRGKEVIVHFDRASFLLYYLASAADRISIDPVGEVRLPGVAFQRTYHRRLLEKLGLGFEEFRYFRYKSVLEAFSQDEMSAADREQYGRMADVIYETIRRGVVEERGMSEEGFDVAVEDEGLLTAAQALELGFVDEVGRWPALLETFEVQGNRLQSGWSDPGKTWRRDERWGRPPTVALVLAEGDCALDEGIHGRATSAHLRDLADRKDVRAVVFRADSPGGDPLPSDLVASALQEIRDVEKPVVVSQGDVAASGGYLISLNCDRLFTTPLTVTGSIGVISGWVWDAGFGEKTGLSADGVQRGSHADLNAGLRFPLLDVRLPLRPMTEFERERVRETTMELYDEFVSRVATARKRTEQEIEEVAEGRVWMGEDAVEQGLCDDLGGLTRAIHEARLRGGLDADEEVLLEEYPARRRFRLPASLSWLPSIRAWLGVQPPAFSSFSAMEDLELRTLRRFAERNGTPLLQTSIDAIPREWIDPLTP